MNEWGFYSVVVVVFGAYFAWAVALKDGTNFDFKEISLKSGDTITKEHAKKYKLTCINGLVVNKDGLNLLNGNGKPLGCE